MQTAIIGMAFRFPGANDSETFWQNLIDRTSSVTEIPAERWDWRALWGDSKLETNKTYSKWGGFVDDADAFDNTFFGFLPKVVQTMDPQQRIMLELAWNCMEDAGVAPSSLAGRKVAVVVGVFNHDYKELQERGEIAIEAHHSTGTATAVIANRVSHFFDFRGPSVPVDTACSSSLNAIHNAIQALEYDGCEVALAGGINLMLTPTRHISFSKMGMLSPTGTCKTFDDSADGYVRGEGAAFLLLKPLDKALADGDPIHGVIKGTAVNHCGGTYTLTYPSPRAQSEVIVAAHERAGIPVDTLGFVELHGTGTPKGDPIEFEGLNNAFTTLAERQGIALPQASCGLSSVKTNIGHLEAAAGVAGVVKVLLAMRHRRMPAFQNFSTLNNRITMDGTPFHPLGDSRPWLPSAPGVPLRAGVSSFGFGGTNAHLVLEEAPSLPAPKPGKRKPVDAPVLIALSAKTDDALGLRIAQLRDWLRKDEGRTPLVDLARTLLLGRELLDCRFACVAASHDDLIATLDQAVVAGAAQDEAVVEEADALQALLARWSTLKKQARIDALPRLARGFRQGLALAWASLFEGASSRTVRLPGYPFARNRFWIPAPIEGAATRAGAASLLHPLLHRNVSTLGKVRFAATFDGSEHFLADHVVDDSPVLPGVACLEMAREAAARALSLPAGSALRLRDVVWQRAIRRHDTDLSLVLELATDAVAIDAATRQGALDFLILDAQSEQACCRGRIEIGDDAGPTLLDVDAIARDCVSVHVADACYRAFDALGLHYGPSHRAILDLRVGDGQCLARIAMPEAQRAAQHTFTIHPATADAALQAAVALVSGVDAVRADAVCLPFALDRVEVAAYDDDASPAVEFHAWARYAQGSSASDRMPRIDVDLLERPLDAEAGAPARVRLAFRGLNLRPRSTETSSPHVQASATVAPPAALADALFSPLWVDAPVASAARAPASILLVGADADIDALLPRLIASSAFAESCVDRLRLLPADAPAPAEGEWAMRAGVLADAEALVAAWAAQGKLPEHLVWVAPSDAASLAPQVRIDVGARSVFALVKALLRGPKRLRVVHLAPVADHATTDPDAAGLGGFYKTLTIEKPSFTGRVVQATVDGDDDALAAAIATELLADDKTAEVRHVGGRRQVRMFAPVVSKALVRPDAPPSPGFREGGAYLITGGMGALGLIVARHLCAHHRATVFLTGRSAPSEAQRPMLAALAALGGRAVYLACDVGNRDDVRRAIAEIRTDLAPHGQGLNGILHSAGVIEDNFLLRKPADAFARVIAPKTLGTWHLDLETRDDPLDLFVLFSSVTGALGNVGQSDYAFGNAFEDAFAAEREGLRAAGERHGKTVSINWPYWKDGGMRLSDKEEEALQRAFGIVPLLTAQGIEVLEYAVKQAQPQIVVMPFGDLPKVHAVLGVVADAASTPDAAVSGTAVAAADGQGDDNPADWHAPVARHLAGLFASQLGISADFEHDRSFKEYGFDSVVMIDLIADLEKRFGTLPKTLFFEYQTLGELTGYFVEHHPDHCRAIARPDAVRTVASPAQSIALPIPAQSRAAAYTVAAPTVSSSANVRAERHDDTRVGEPIAIVGLAGRYPQAPTLQAFWENLRLGRDCVEEIPADRPDIAAKFAFQSGDPARARSYSRWGGFLRDVDRFDPLFFNISPKEAENLDPNERLFLEIASLAIEDAGYTPDTLARARGHRENPVGVYVGLMWGDYQLHGVDRPRDSWVVPHSFYWAVANRVSYQFNFSGPSLTIDTACSSSLTAIHLACQAIRQGEIDVAIAGAVNLSLHPNKYNLLSDMHFLSTDGRCRAFGEGGDGYVPGEGVGAVLLKPLSKALADGDHIHGIIRGSSINHGGKASGFTVPNPKRQAALVQDALDAAGVDPRHISYVEAHGTGTSLGDPIEIAGLSKAYAQVDRQSCAIGSAKANVGHLEAAAGIAGLTKVLLQMKHRSLVPSIHSDTPNPYIDFPNSPFRVQRALQPWSRPLVVRDGVRAELPRLAGLSSFGAGGSNGHLVIEEHVDDVRADLHADVPVVVLLSARRDIALREMAANLSHHLDAEQGIGLQDTAYTLQLGRIAMEHRIAFVVSSRDALQRALRAYAADGTLSGQAWSGQRDGARRDPAVAARLAANTTKLPQALAARDLPTLAQAWVDGASIDWTALHAPGSRRRVPLPGYAFQRQRYWIETSDIEAGSGAIASLHPLIDANVSTLDEQAFIKTFHPDAFYLRDHRLGDNRILPGVAYLELALQAARLAAPGRRVRAIEDVRWFRPVIVNDAPQAMRISLLPERGAVSFNLCAADDDARRPYAQGAVILAEAREVAVDSARIDLQAIAGGGAAMTRAAIDAAFEAMGFAFGDSFRVFESLRHTADEALGVLHLPAIGGVRTEDFVLHPALLDGAVRVSLGIDGFAASRGGIRVPVRLRRIEIFDVPGERVWVHARRTARPQGETTPDQSHFDIALCDAEGRVLVRIEQLTIQPAPQLAVVARHAAKPAVAARAPAVASVQAEMPSRPATSADAGPDALLVAATRELVDLLAGVTKLPADQIDPDVSLENYGIDSVMIATLNRELEQRFGDLPKTLFFEYQELSGVAGYLAEQHADALRARMPAVADVPVVAPAPVMQTVAEVAVEVAVEFAGSIDADAPRHAVVAFLRRAVGETIGLAAAEVDPIAPLEQYGIDSVMIVKLTTRLEETFGAVSKTLFFEYQDIASLAEHLTESFPDVARGMVSTPAASVAATTAVASVAQVAASPASRGDASGGDASGKDVLDALVAHLHRALGPDAATCDVDTPLAAWPFDPVNATSLLHALSQDFEGVLPYGPYRHDTLAEWAATLQWRPERAGRAVSVFANAAAALSATRSPARGFRRLRGGEDRFEADDIAIVGLSGRYPGADDLDAFWRNLSAGRDSISEVPLSRWDHSRYFHPDRSVKGAVYSKWGGFIDGVDRFDARFFNISAREAELIDPQERLFLQTAWECVEDACYTRQSLKGRSVGVFVGVMWGYYGQIEVTDEQLKSGRPSPPFSSIANRVSYVMNFNGPSMAVDTMCSSSLTAIHLSCRAIHSGDCDMAIAGGVNVIVHPNKYQKLSAAQFLSSDGRCRAFGADGDGYVPGEGVGAVLLKRLSQAIEDGDHIYGVIKATSLNHGGKTNGFTVPNQNAQTSVIGKAIERAGWDPRSIDYIETHGTGTSLGDPIEIAGLGRAFAQAANARSGPGTELAPQRCRIGSVKSNVGHLESAAAIAGLTKILLQFRHGAIAPSLHSTTLNPNIDFARTPFRVVQREEAWRPLDARTPRRAGLSSFGAGGANAHCLVEDHPRALPAPADGRPALFILSADGETRLARYVDRVIAFLERGGDPDVGLDLRALAYASQVGREVMDERLAVVATDIDGLLAALRAYRAGVAHDGLLRGSPRRQGEKLDAIVDASEKDALIRAMISGGRLAQLARAWVSLLDVDWARHADALVPEGVARPRRMPFPTMPFLTERYWVEEKRADATVDALHPLIDRNLSTLAEQVYRKRFDGQEFYLRDHIVHTDRDRKILPGVAYLEMARAAGDLAVGEGWHADRVRNLVWRQPFEIAGAPDSLTVRMHSDDAGLRFEIARDGDGTVCVDGELAFREAGDAVVDEWLDIDAILARGTPIEADHDAIYDGFRRMGFHFGPSFRVTQARYRLAEGALCRLQLPEHLRTGLDQYGLHPALLDASLRAGLAVNVGANGEPVVPIVPFALDELEFRHPLTETCYAHVVRSHDALAASLGDASSPGTDATAYKYDIVVTDDTGRVLVKLHGFTGRPLVRQPVASRRVVQYFGDTLVPAPLVPVTATRAPATTLIVADDATLAGAIAAALPAGDRSAIALIGGDVAGDAHGFDPFDGASADTLFAALRARDLLPDRIVLSLGTSVDAALSADGVDTRALRLGTQAVRRLFLASERANPGAAVRLLSVSRASDRPLPQHEAIIGYARSLLTVNHRFELSSLQDDGVDAGARPRAILAELDVAGGFGGHEIVLRDGARFRRTLRALTPDVVPASSTLRERGSYLITGGAGKLGLVVARWLAKECRARLVLSGRSVAPGDALIAEIDALRTLGAEVVYCSADTSDAAAVATLVATAQRVHGELHGVFHCAGVASDQPITVLDDKGFDTLLAPKLDGTVLLDRATASLPLDLFVDFSSISALIGDLGSGAYAVGNRFMDAHARWRDSLRAQGLRHGRSLSIGWPLWATGGMEITGGDASVFGFSGLQPMSEAEGLVALATLLATDEAHAVVAVGDPQRIAKTLRLPQPVTASPATASPPPAAAAAPVRMTQPVPSMRTTHVEPSSRTERAAHASDDDLPARVARHVCSHVAAVTKTRPESIDIAASFEQCGMDSVLMLELHTALRNDFEGLPKTALFEYDSAARMAQYLIAQHAEQVRKRFAIAGEAKPVATPAVAHASPPAAVQAKPPVPVLASKRMPTVRGGAPAAAEGIAIIGIAGEFPGAADLDGFWLNLREGRDCLTRIPDDRGFASALNRHRSRSGQPIADKGGFIADVDLFDPALFRMNQTDADKADPQLRVLLRAAWRALEDAAYAPEALAASRVGVFVGGMNEDFTRIAAELQARSADYLGPGSVSSELSNRLSYLMNFQGPSLTVSTACSASLTALHLARRAILSGDCEVAVVGGVNLSLHASKYQLLHDMKVLSPDGHERTFDDGANGLVPSEGAAVVILKPLGRALADGDHVHGVIRASRIGHAGTGAGQFMPNLRVLEETAAECIREAGVAVEDITCIEAHGTGTELGDPIELKALANALRRGSDATGWCAVGTKAAVGHMEAASGLCSLVKVLLAMRHGEVAPCAKLKRVNGSFDQAGSPFRFPDAATPWPRNARGTRIAGINSFGMGGSNAFVVVESHATAPAEAAPEHGAQQPGMHQANVFLLSARSEAGLRGYAAALAAFVRVRTESGMTPAAFADLAYATQVGRVAFRHRLAVVASDPQRLVAALDAIAGDASLPKDAHVGDIDARIAADMLRLLDGEAGLGFVDTLLRARDLGRLAELWTRGATIDWLELHHGQSRHRVAFPGMPFEQVRCDLRNLVDPEALSVPIEVFDAVGTVSNHDDAVEGVVLARGWHRLADCDDSALLPMTADDDDDALRRYWVEHLGDASDTSVEVGGSLSLDAAGTSHADDATDVHCVSEVVDDELVRMLQTFGARHGIALETLVSAAWAVLVNRYTKARNSQFGLLRAMDHPEPVLLPLRVRTVGRQKMLEWLSELQAALLRKHRQSLAPIERIGEWVGQGPLFDCVIAFDVADSAAVVDGERRLLMSESHPSAPRPRMELVAAAGEESLELSLIYRAVSPDYAGAGMVLEQLKVLLEGIVSNPDRMPSALGMRTRGESREQFWKVMEATTG